MTWIIVVLIVLAVLLVAGLAWTAMKRKQQQVGRQRADELRSEAAATATEHPEQEARAREVEAQAEQAQARADQLSVQAQEERTSYDMTRAQEEDHLREADRVDPDVDHEARDHEARDHEGDVDGSPRERGRTGPPTPPE